MPYLVKYSSEIGTKTTRMKWKFIKKLAENIRSGLKVNYPREVWKEVRVHNRSNHIIIEEGDAELSELLERVAGIQYFVRAESFTFEDEESFCEKASAFFRPLLDGHESFAVKARSRGEVSIGRKRCEILLGDRLVDLAPVNLDRPSITCHVELDYDTVHLYTQKFPGMGGTPLGIHGTAMNLFSGGIDSPVAAYRTYRIGLDQHFIFFDLGGQEQKRNTFELFRFLKKNYGSGSSGKLIEVDLIPLIEEIRKAEGRYQNLILKYVFYRIAEGIARIHSASSLITGESLGQVSTQTNRNLITLDRCINMSVHRPLFSFTKSEIKTIAERIGSYDEAYKGQEFCALTTKKVTTGASYKELTRALSALDLEAKISEAIEGRLLWDLNTKGELEAREPGSKHREKEKRASSSDPSPSEADHVIDLRSDEEIASSNMPLQGEHIPFEQAMDEYFHWDPEASYLFVCNYGSKSRIIAHYMQKEGFKAFYREGGVVHTESS